ncbi:MAG: hypothetical protein ACE5EK_07135 [Nitrospinales bacterium]
MSRDTADRLCKGTLLVLWIGVVTLGVPASNFIVIFQDQALTLSLLTLAGFIVIYFSRKGLATRDGLSQKFY